MTTLTNDQLDTTLGGNGPAKLTPAQRAAAENAAGYKLCQFVETAKNGPFPAGGSLDQMVDHGRREQQSEAKCAKLFPL